MEMEAKENDPNASQNSVATASNHGKISDKTSLLKRNVIYRAFLWHYGNTTQRTLGQEQLDQEQYLVSKIKFNPWILMPAAMIVQFCVGSLHSWSVFNIPIDEAITGDPKSGQAPLVFYIAVGMLGISAATMGPWLGRNGPKRALLLSSSVFFLGNLISGLAVYLKAMWLLYIGYGVFGGFGMGLGYISPVSSLQKWFPHRRGLAAGFAVSGFGIGSIVTGKVILPLIDAVGLPLTFVVLGSCYFGAMTCAAFIFRVPPPGYSVSNTSVDISNSKETSITNTGSLDETNTNSRKNKIAIAESEIHLTLIESIKSLDYLLLYIMFFSNTLFGLVVISRLSNMITQLYGESADSASTIVSIYGGLNLFGKIFFSTLSDKIGRKACFLIMLTTQTIVVATFPLYTENRTYWAFVLCMIALSACDGGGFGVIPAFLADMFGESNIGACHGLILTAWSIIGVVAGLTFTAIYNSKIESGWTTADAYPYVINSYWILPLVVAGLLAGIFVRTTLKDRLLPPINGQICRFRLFNKVVRVTKTKTTIVPQFEILSSEDYDKEWEEYLLSKSTSPRESDSEFQSISINQ